jgi:hypothetical protein
MGKQIKTKQKLPWWSYKVKKGDNNYEQRTDRKNDFFDFDSDQNFQIELHYKNCCDGFKQFGDKHTIIGDQNRVQNGYIYQVWGTSSDPNTWFEQNATI